MDQALNSSPRILLETSLSLYHFTGKQLHAVTSANTKPTDAVISGVISSRSNLVLSVRACTDAIVLLSHFAQLTAHAQFKFVFGANANKAVQIWKGNQQIRTSDVTAPLSCDEYRYVD